MYQRTITTKQMSHIFDDLEYTGSVHEGPVWVTTGSHPELGAVVTIQDDDPKHVTMHSEFPSDLPASRPVRKVH